MSDEGPWHLDADVTATKHNQLWRNHLLAWALLRHPDSKYAMGTFTVVHHPEDTRCRDVIEGYRDLLRDESTFASFGIGEIVNLWKPLTGQWIQEFERRYVLLDESEAAM